jgi:hypothetical protein
VARNDGGDGGGSAWEGGAGVFRVDMRGIGEEHNKIIRA